jgi:hypothetical protein
MMKTYCIDSTWDKGKKDELRHLSKTNEVVITKYFNEECTICKNENVTKIDCVNQIRSPIEVSES